MSEKSYPIMTHDELEVMMNQISKVYDIVRIVDVSRQKTITFHPDGSTEIDEKKNCYMAWNKNGRCLNCASAKAFIHKKRTSKFEFVGNDIYHVMAQYITVDDDPYVLEILEKDSDAILTGAFKKDRFINQIQEFEERVYKDSLTQVRNRAYLDEQLISLNMDAVAMLDVDNFKEVNDTHGHICGDQALRAVAKTITNKLRSDDSVVRYGGDEFFIAFSTINQEVFQRRVEEIRQAVEEIKLEDFPDVKLTISIGGIYGRGVVQDMIVIADQQLYEAKETKNNIKIYG